MNPDFLRLITPTLCVLWGTGNGKVHFIISPFHHHLLLGETFPALPSSLYISPLSSAPHFQTHPPYLGATTPVDTVALRACETRLVLANPYTIRVQRPLLRPIATACYLQLNYNVSWTKRQGVFITPALPPSPYMADLRSGAMSLWNCVILCDLGWNYNVYWRRHSHEARPLKELCSLRFAQRSLSFYVLKKRKKKKRQETLKLALWGAYLRWFLWLPFNSCSCCFSVKSDI